MQENHLHYFSGNTMGTVYNIKYLAKKDKDYKAQIDSLLIDFNKALSTWDPESEISKFNRGLTLNNPSDYFLPVLEKSLDVWKHTDSAFDPTVMPLVEAWGFLDSKNAVFPDSSTIDSILNFVGFDKIEFNQNKISKTKPSVALDFSAVAKGYGVDVIGNYLQEQSVNNFMIEIGGEILCKGENPGGQPWKIGINVPDTTASRKDLYAIVSLEDKAVATSGNYRNYFVKNGVMYSHTINPVTGYTVNHNLLSASVFADDCMTADAYATAMMVLGLDGSRKLLEKLKNIDAYLIYSTEEGNFASFTTRGIAEAIKNTDE